jgi:hypothetical protein
MEILYKRNTDLTDGELDALFALHYSTIDEYSKKNRKIVASTYKEKWTKYIKENNKLVCTIAVSNGYLIGFLLLSLEENENYISDFYIANEYQNDGNTFKFLVENAFKIAKPNKMFTGRIWMENTNAKNTFLNMGAILKNGIYSAPYEKIKEWIEKNKNN